MKNSKKSATKSKAETEVKFVAIGTTVTDRATGITGAITHVVIGIDRTLRYHVQPRLIDSITGHPVPGVWIQQQRITSGKVLPMQVVLLPVEVLGTFVADTLSGMRGMVVGIKLHPRGCVHVIIQPAGLAAGAAIAHYECDYRALESVPELPVVDSPSPSAVRPVPSVC